jgi:hypothetical protein
MHIIILQRFCISPKSKKGKHTESLSKTEKKGKRERESNESKGDIPISLPVLTF